MTILDTLGQGDSGMPATSGTWVFSVTCMDIIRQAMLNLGLLEESEVPTNAEYTDCKRVLNMIVKQLAGGMDKAPGFKMFQRQRGDLFLSQSKYLYLLGATGDNWAGGADGVQFPALFAQSQLTAGAAAAATVLSIPAADVTTFNIGDQAGVVLTSGDIFWSTIQAVGASSVTFTDPLPSAAASTNYVYAYTRRAQRPVEIVTCVLRDENDNDTPLRKLTIEEYEALPTKVQPGFLSDPMAFYYEAQMAENLGHFYIDVAGAQDVTKHLHIVYLRESMDFNAPGDAPEFPQEWFLHLCWELSLQICGMFEGDWTVDRQGAYENATNRAREANPQVTAMHFQPDDE